MSLILDALNRAENERKNQNTVPDLNTLHRPLEIKTSAVAHPMLWWVVGVASLLAIIIVVLVIMLRREPTAQMTVAAPAQQSPGPSASSVPPIAEHAPVMESELAPTSPETVAPTVTVVPQTIIPNDDVEKLYAAEKTETAMVDTGVSELYAAEAAIAAASETIIDPFNSNNAADVSTGEQEQAPPRTFDSISNIPDFNALPWNMRQQIPTISYARHNYLANGISSVVINNQTTGVGNIIGTGQFIVQEIYIDGVVLKHGNAVFKLRALNGWINM